MDSAIVVVIAIAVLIILFALGVHIGLTLGIVGFLGTVVVKGNWTAGLTLLTSVPYYSTASYLLAILPLFFLMGMFAFYGGISQGAYRTARNWLGSLPGGLSIATVWACVAFGATCGSNLAAASVFTKTSLPEMTAAGYDRKSACGVIGAASTISQLIPPSILLVFFAIITQQSVARLLLAGVLPGLVLAVVISVGVWVMAVRNPRLGPPIAIRVTWREKFVSLRELWPVGVLALIVMGGIYGGVFSPTEAGAVGAAAALIIAVARKGLNWTRLRSAMVETVEFTCTLILTLIGAMIFARFLAISGFGAKASELLMGLKVPPMVILVGLMLLCLLMGCFIDAVSIMAITLPIVFAPVLEMGFDPTWLGIVIVLVLTTGALTPPFGLTVFVIKAAAGDDMSVVDVFRGSFWFFTLLLISAAIMIAFPQISLFLPNMRQGL